VAVRRFVRVKEKGFLADEAEERKGFSQIVADQGADGRRF
jgi:hypothetical protein